MRNLLHQKKWPFVTLTALAMMFLSSFAPLLAQGTTENQTPENELPKATVREVFVPTDEMATLLENCKDHVLLSRDEFESLLIESLQQKEDEPEANAPVASVFLSSDLTIVIEGEQARIKAILEWESLTDKLHAEVLTFDAVAIQSAVLNDEPARLGFAEIEASESRNDNDTRRQYTLFWQGKGRQRLVLDLTTALAVDSVRQELTFAVPRAPKATETLAVPGDVELKSGAMILNRRVEGESLDRRTHFELLPDDSRQHLVLTLNSHRTRMVRSVLAKSVQFAEVTEHYEKLHATFSLDVLHQPISLIEFVVPPSFEMIDVNSPQLARWGIVERDGRSILEMRFREPVSDQVLLNLTAVHFFETDSAAETLAEWSFPAFEPIDVSANTAVFGLLLDAGWDAHKIDADRLVAIAPQILNRTIPDSVFEASVDAPSVRTVAAWYAPNADEFRITCEFLKPKAMFDVISHQLLTLNDREQILRGLMQVAPRHEKLFELKLDVPADWTITRVTNASDMPLPFVQKDSQLRIQVTNGIAPGTIFPVFFEASGNTPSWFSDWEKQELPFPRFCVVDAAADSGTIAIDVEEDMIVASENDVRLVPLDNKERTEFLAGVPTDLAFRYLNQPYSTDLSVTRTKPRLTARTYAFFGFSPSLLSVRYELHYVVEQAKTKSLAFLLPVETPDKITIRGLNVAIKDYADSIVTVEDRQYRRWDVQLADSATGPLTLAVDFEQATTDETTQSLPLATAYEVAWQTGLVSVEGHEELNLTLAENVNKQQIRQVDVGELAATQYIPGKRLLGVFEGVTENNILEIVVTRNPDFQLPVSLVQMARGNVEIAADGKRVTRVVYDLKTRATFLKINLAANEEIWTVSLDGKTIKPQKRGSAIMVDIPARDDAVIRELEVIWSTQRSTRTTKLFASSAVRLPDLMIPQCVENSNVDKTEKQDKEESKTTWRKIPVTRVAWNVSAPPGYEVTRIGGRRIEMETPRPLVLQYWNKMFASSEAPRERRSRGIGCSAAPKPSAMRIVADSAEKPASATMSADSASMGEELRFERERYGRDSSKKDYEEEIAEMDDAFESSDSVSYEYGRALAERATKNDRPCKTGDLSKSVGISNESGLVGRFASGRGDAVPYQRQTLQTIRPVQVQFQPNLSSALQRHVQFQLVGGSESQLKVRMVNTRIVTFGIYFVWGGILCVGLCLLKASRRVRAIYVLAVLSIGTLLVLVPRLEMFAGLFDEAVKAGFWVFVIYILVGWYRMIKKNRTSVVTSVLVLLAFVALCGVSQADHSTDAFSDVSAKTISLPEDAIVAFYNAESLLTAPLLENGMPDPKALSQSNQKLLVPYAKYVELWNLVHPQAKVEPVEKPPVDYVTTFGEYRATLRASDEISIAGKAEIEVLTDKPVLFPLPMNGGILTSLTVDGKDAEISLVPQSEPNADDSWGHYNQSQMNSQAEMPSQHSGVPQVHGGFFVVLIHGQGSHTINLTAKFKVDRQGGWRIASGRLPEFPSGKVQLELPEDRMELRCRNVYAQQKWQAQTGGETVDTSLGQNGRFNWSWRSKVTEGEVDQSLTADSELRFNVQEDALVLEWDLTLAFRRGKHESFRMRIPADYLVVSVDGENVRGWENAEADSPDEALIDVELLHAAQETERFHIGLMRKADFDHAENVAVTTPNVGVVGAAMHHGRITLQSSPRLDVKTDEIVNMSMTDLPEMRNSNANMQDSTSDNPLGLSPYRAYRFTTENYRLPMTVSEVRKRRNINIQNIVKLSTHEIKLDSEYSLNMSNKVTDCFDERVILPVGWQIESVSSETPIEWSVKTLETGENELTVIWSVIPANRNVRFSIAGSIMRESDGAVEMPVMTLPDHEIVTQDFVIQTDPAFDVGVSDLLNCSDHSDALTPSWVVASQRSLCRKRFSTLIQPNAPNNGKPSAKLTLIPREPIITSGSITNLQVSNQSVDEMILLDFNIQNAGIRSVQFELPKTMTDAKIDAPLLQRKEIAVNEKDDSVTVTLWLQDEIMNEFRVLIRNNHKLVAEKSYAVTIPKIRTGMVQNQFVVLENADSFDELQVDSTKLVGMRKISRQNKEWANLAAILGNSATEAYLVADKTSPQLSFNMVRRETVKMSGARIGLAETRIVLDENGDYLAEQIYRIDNKTEQFLDLKLPPGAEIWVVRLLTNREWGAKQSGESGDFGQPVKPTTLDGETLHDKTTGVRIPIIKTEVGDLDYVVRIVYAGKCRPIRWAAKLDIPFIEVLNIPVGASYARLHLPENYQYKFDGTMTESDQGGIAKINSEYDKQINAKLQQAAQTGNPYEQARAMSNLDLKGIREYTINKPVFETRVKQSHLLARPGYEIQQSNQPTFGGYQSGAQVSGTTEQSRGFNMMSNASQLEQRFQSQSNARGTNVVTQSESNWKVEPEKSTSVVASEAVGQQFNDVWLKNNSLENRLSSETNTETSDERLELGSVISSDRRFVTSQLGIPGEQFSEKSQRQSETAALPQSRVNNENRSQQMPAQSLKSQERLNDGKLALKLAGKSSASQADTSMLQKNYEAKMQPSGFHQAPATVNNVELYRQRLAEQNAPRPAAERQESQSAMSAAPLSDEELSDTLAFQSRDSGMSAGGYGGGTSGGMSGGGPGGMRRGMGGSSSSSPYGISGGIGMSGVVEPVDAVVACEPETVVPNEYFDHPDMSTTMAAKTASLDIEIPLTGTVYVFTAPQAENRLSVSGVSTAGSQRLKDFGAVLGMIAVCAMIGFLVARRKQRRNERG